MAILVLASALTAACDGSGVTDPGSGGPTAGRVALVVQEGTRPALYLQDANGSGRTRIHFTGARELPGNTDQLPAVRDENLLALGPIAWSPDGEQLAVVATLAHDQSEIVVVKADGSDARVASLNTQIILTAPRWSPDGTKLAYGMSTVPGAGGVQLFVTDLAASSWRQLTHGPAIGSAGTNVRWSSDGANLYQWRTIGQSSTAPFDWLSRISTVDATTGTARVLLDSIPGMVQDVAAGGAWALVIRHVSQPAGQDELRDLVRKPLVGSGPEMRLAQGNLWWARASADDRGVVFTADADLSQAGTTLTASVVPIGGGKVAPIGGVDANTLGLDVLFR